jgi:hypothetical protein
MRFEVPAAKVEHMPNYEAALEVIDQQNVADMGESGEQTTKAEWEPVAIGSRYMDECNSIASILQKTQDKASRSAHGIAIRMFHPNPAAPRIFDFDGWPGVVLMVGAMQMEVKQLPLLTQRLMEPASRGTLAALRAHETRWRDAAAVATTDEQRAACTARADSFQLRIVALIAAAASKPVLAAPEPSEQRKAVEAPEVAPAPEVSVENIASAMAAELERRGISQQIEQPPANGETPPELQTSAEKAAAKRKQRAARRAASMH